MSKTVRPRRSVLYMPGANTRALEKARTLPADALIFDLEDAVAPDAKEAARANVVRGRAEQGLRQARDRHPLQRARARPGARPTSRPSPPPAPMRSWCPRSRAPPMSPASCRCSTPPARRPRMAVWAMMETPRGILRAEEIAGSHPAAGAVRHGHQRSGEGHARAPYADAPADDHRARARHAGGARLWPHHPRRRLQRHPGRRRASAPSASRGSRWASTARR